MEGERLKEIRKDHGDTQQSLAYKLGLSTVTVSKWEQGLSDPNLATLVRICRMYSVASDYLLGLSDDDPFLVQSRKRPLREDSQKMLDLFAAFLQTQEK